MHHITHRISLAILSLPWASPSLSAQCIDSVRIESSHSVTLPESFGWRARLSGDRLVVGAQHWAHSGIDHRAVHTFVRDGLGEWNELEPLEDPLDDAFATTFALDGGTLLVERRRYSQSMFGAFTGTLLVYAADALDPTGWTLVHEISSPSPHDSERFGAICVLDGDRLAVVSGGGLLFGHVSGPVPPVGGGLVRLFERDLGGPGNWGLRRTIRLPNPLPGEQIAGLALDGDTLALGAAREEVGPFSGTVYFYDRNTGGADRWGLVATRPAPVPSAYAFHGTRIELQGDLAIVAGGAAASHFQVLERDLGGPNNWGEREARPTPWPVGTIWQEPQLALAGEQLLIGVPWDDTVDSDAGAVYRFDRHAGGTDQWGLVDVERPADLVAGSRYGEQVQVEGETEVVVDGDVSSTWPWAGRLGLRQPCDAQRYCVSAPNSVSPVGATIAVGGTSRLSGDGLELSAGPMPNDSLGLFLIADTSAQLPFLDGSLCVQGTIGRGAVLSARGQAFTTSLDLANLPPGSPPAQVGATLYLQAIYRDPAAGGTGANLSDGIAVLLRP